jgi:Mg-chelatase subunit ChlI
VGDKADGLDWGAQIWATCEGQGKELEVLEISTDKPVEKAQDYVSPLTPPEGMFPCPARNNTQLQLDRGMISYLQTIVVMVKSGQRMNIRITGPQGTGKTTLANNVANALGWDFVKVDVGGIRETSDWFSRIIAQNGSTEVVPTLFAYAITRPQTVILLDEMNRCPTEVHNAIYGILDEHAWVWDEDLKIKLTRAPQVLVLATLNLATSNVGVFDADSALIDRFPYEVRMPVPEEEMLARIMETHTGQDTASWLAKLASTINEKTTLTHTVSIRALIAAAMLINEGVARFEAAKHTVASTYSRDGDVDSEYAIIINLMKGLKQ